MPRTADHDERRRQVAEALLRAVAARGLARTTLIDVADEAGTSVGLVQRYFRSKSDLLRFGVEYLYERAEERIAEVELVPPVRSVLYRVTETLLPLDDERRTELAVWLEFVPATLTDPEMSRIHRDTTRRLVDGIAGGITSAQKHGELSTGVDARAEAAALVAFVDGLTMHHIATAEIFDTGMIRDALHRFIDQLFARDGRS
ncbi:AcrR family transcriptional regulator [Lipingzhangella halophila]|uniref:AcrR family transcriptional regulator n=1 Tax=Lipingzhangella halophila TaxID=1783352 RepID=A0A7W7RMX8_9ACTN|nr:TetR/AcrR family transcriptional regulator [Lipingzhangella halophila]MBB4934911.1 AcrR family transcriptional regulator [Lipingzhangella halophila]